MAREDTTREGLGSSIEASIMDALEDDRVRYERTKNPLYARDALNAWFILNRHRTCTESAALPMPEWIAARLDVVASRTTDLARGLDFGEAPAHYETSHAFQILFGRPEAGSRLSRRIKRRIG